MASMLEDIRRMKERGMSEEEIIKNLQEKGASPKEIDDSISQSKIKSAISQPETDNSESIEGMQPSLSTQPQARQKAQTGAPTQPSTQPITREIEKAPALPEIQPPRLNANQPPQEPLQPEPAEPAEAQTMPQAAPAQPYPELRAPQPLPPPAEPTPGPAPTAPGMPETGYGEYPPPQTQLTEEYGGGYEYGVPEYQGYQPYGGLEAGGAEMMSEVAEQIVAEKIDKISKRVSEFAGFKTKAEAMIENIDTRLQKIEASIDQLQISIMKKIADYVQDIGDIKTEMKAMQGSFGKVIGENIQELKKIAKKPAIKKGIKRKAKKRK